MTYKELNKAHCIEPWGGGKTEPIDKTEEPLFDTCPSCGDAKLKQTKSCFACWSEGCPRGEESCN